MTNKIVDKKSLSLIPDYHSMQTTFKIDYSRKTVLFNIKYVINTSIEKNMYIYLICKTKPIRQLYITCIINNVSVYSGYIYNKT